MKRIAILTILAVGVGCFVGMTGFGRGTPDVAAGRRADKVVLVGDTMSVRVRGNPRTVEQEASSEWGSPHPCLQVMDDAGAALGQKRSGLRGEEFERVYHEHIQHILMARERVRQASVGANR